jgi:hypothetical protein
MQRLDCSVSMMSVFTACSSGGGAPQGGDSASADAQATGAVVGAQQPGRVKGCASVALRSTHLQAGDVGCEVRTARIAREAEAAKGQDESLVGHVAAE